MNETYIEEEKIRLRIKAFDEVTARSHELQRQQKKCIEFVLKIRLQALKIHFSLKRGWLYFTLFLGSILLSLKKCNDSLLQIFITLSGVQQRSVRKIGSNLFLLYQSWEQRGWVNNNYNRGIQLMFVFLLWKYI